jgi:hypothetical protein
VAQLADDLRRIRSAGGEESAQFYQFVEPVQLQAVCYQMWEKLHVTSGNRITTDDVAKYANVDTALINFYEETIQKTVAATDISEIDLRAWFDRELITEAGTRNMVFRGEETTGGLPTAVADFVQGQFILAEVVRPGGAWYELVHERFVEPITAANNRWRQDQPLIQLAQGWVEAGRPVERLLSGPQLEQLNPADWRGLGPLVADYVAAARAAQEEAKITQQARELEQEQQRAQEAQQAAERQRRLKNFLAVAVAAFMIATIVALSYLNVSVQQSRQADEARATAEADAARANMAEATAAFQAAEAIAARETSDARGSSLIDSLAAQEQQIMSQLSPLPPTLITENGTPPVLTTLQPTGTRDLSAQATMQALDQQLNQVRATQTAVTQELLLESIETLVIGRSVRGVAIEATQIGFGSKKIVFVGGIHSGIAPGTVALGEATIDYFRNHIEEIPQTITLIVIPNLNPDSVRTSALEGRYNANGVDLNRNWDCNWRANPFIRGERRENAGGTAPNSEPETRALKNYLLEVRPIAVIFWAGPDLSAPVYPGGCPDVKPATQWLAGLYADSSGYREEILSENTIEGDASNWLSKQGIPSIFVLLPRAAGPDFERNIDGIKRVIRYYAYSTP